MKKLLILGLLGVYPLALLASGLLVIKPGAGIFYHKVTLKMSHCSPEAGYAVRCPVTLPEAIFPAENVLLFEDGQQLARENTAYVSTAGDGSYATEGRADGGYAIVFAPRGNSDPFNDGKTYRAYFALRFLTPSLGIFVFGFLASGVVSFGSFAFRQWMAVKPRKSLLREAIGLFDRYFDRLGATLRGMRSVADGRWQFFWRGWGKIAEVSGLAVGALVFMEWIFQVSGTSFMDRMSLAAQLAVFLLSSLFLACIALTMFLALLVFGLILRLVRLGWAAILVAELVPAGMITALIFLIVDNFTYVVFHFGILTTQGLPRMLYGVMVGVIFGIAYGRRLSSWQGWDQKESFPKGIGRLGWVRLGVIGVFLAAAIVNFDPGGRVAAAVAQPKGAFSSYPNILLIGSDGMSASHLGVYGYDRETTPTLSQLRDTFLVAENAFTNSSETFGSVAAILTGKLPVETGVIYPPNILQGSDAFEHLPGILLKAGYQTVEIAVPHYVDAFNMNIQDGFEIVNGQHSLQKDFLVKAWRDAGFAPSAYFIQKLEEKLANRLLHALYLETIDNPFDVVREPASWLEDQQKMDELIYLLSQADQPLFAHVHLMGTHGQRFTTQVQFSLGEEQTEDWMVDFYDDSILVFDRYIGRLIEFLKTSGQYDRTVLILYSDHAMKWASNERIPLIFHFPNDQYAGAISSNAQNIDIAPTILNYLGRSIPTWMSGRSLLRSDLDNSELIFAARVSKTYQDEFKLGYLDPSQLKPPFYQFQSIQVIACNQWYELNLWSVEWRTGTVAGYTGHCEEAELPTREKLLQRMITMLRRLGFDVTSLEK